MTQTDNIIVVATEEGAVTLPEHSPSTEEKRKFIVSFYTPSSPARAFLFVAPQTYEKLYALESPVSVESIAQVVRENGLTDPNPIIFNENNSFKLRVVEKETQEEFEKRVDIAYAEAVVLEQQEKAERLAKYEKLKLEFSKGEIV